MRLTSISAIYLLFWALSFFLVLPFRLRQRGPGEESHVPGEVESAPPRFSLGRTCLWTTVVGTLLFAAFYLNYVEGWLPVERLDLVPPALLNGG